MSLCFICEGSMMATRISHEHEFTCVVVCRSNSNLADTISSSGIFLSPTYVLAPGCLLGCSTTSQPVSSTEFEVIVRKLDSESTRNMDANYITHWECAKLSTKVKKLFAADIKPHPAEDEAIDIDIISTFILLELTGSFKSSHYLLQNKKVAELSLGAEVLVCSTPFGSNHVSEFYNSWNYGIVSKVIDKGVVHLTDVACAPGGQGGLVFTKENMIPAGIVIHPVIWRMEECTSLSITAALWNVLDNLFIHLQSVDIDIIELTEYLQVRAMHMSPATHLPNVTSNRIVRVRNGRSWGSGILVSETFAITCCHVIKGHSSNSITVHSPTKQLRATVIFESAADDIFDLAVLKLPESMHELEILPAVSRAYVGTAITAQAYGLFQRETIPNVSLGIIAKVCTTDDYDCKLVTTCKVHPGSSGGGIIDESGRIIGMITANTCDKVKNIVYSNISLVLPLHLLYPAIVTLCSSGDIRGFKDVENKLRQNDLCFSRSSKL